MLIQQFSSEQRPPTCMLSIDDLRSLIDLAVEQHEVCIKQFVDDIRQGLNTYKNIPSNTPDLEAVVRSQFQLIFEFWGDSGEYVNAVSD